MDYNVIKNIYQTAISGMFIQLGSLVSESIRLTTEINWLNTIIPTITNPFISAIYQQRLQSDMAQLQINQAIIASLGNNLLNVENMYKANANIQANTNEPIIAEPLKEIAEKSTKISGNANMLFEEEQKLISATYNELATTVEEYEKETNLDKKNELSKKCVSLKRQLDNKKANLAQHARNAHANNQMSDQEFEEFENKRREEYKEHSEVYNQVRRLINTPHQVKSNKVTKRRNVQIARAKKMMARSSSQLTPKTNEEVKNQVNPKQPKIKNDAPELKPQETHKTADEILAEKREERLKREKELKSKSRAERKQIAEERKKQNTPLDRQRMQSKTMDKLVYKYDKVSEQVKKLQAKKAEVHSKLQAVNQTQATQELASGAALSSSWAKKYLERKEAHLEKRLAKKQNSLVKRNVSGDLLREREIRANELTHYKQMYGTANNEEYQARMDYLKDLDKQIFGKHKAKRIYKQLSKPTYLLGGSYAEIPKVYLDLKLLQVTGKTVTNTEEQTIATR